MNTVFNIFTNENNSLDNLNKLISVIKHYNYIIHHHTGLYKGCISVPNIKIPKEFISVNEYINSKKIWKQILNFTNNANDIDIYDYIETIVKNWNYVKQNIMCSTPQPTIVFSDKIIFLYYKFKNIEMRKMDINKGKNLNNDKGFELLKPTMQSDINSLFRLKQLNPDLSFKEIITIFKGEFNPEFSKYIEKLDENDIIKEKLIKKFKR